MTHPSPHRHPSPETGGITIVVALMLLVLLTIFAMGASRDSLREVMISATTRQEAMVRNTADSGVEWAVYWLAPSNAETGGASGSPASAQFITATNELRGDATAAGQIRTMAPVSVYDSGDGRTDQFTVSVSRIGKFEPPGMDQKLITDWRLRPDAWCVRADATVAYEGGLAFKHAREAWISVPIRF